MEDKKLVRVFDRVKLSQEREDAMLADLLRETKEVSGMKQTNRRRIPAAALVAAALVVLLAGTALAAGYLDQIRIRMTDDYLGDSSHRNGYSVDMPESKIPAASLSEEVFAAFPGPEAEDNFVWMSFDSRLEAEAFLGLDLADNEEISEKRGCTALITYSSEGLPTGIFVWTNCKMKSCCVSEMVLISTDAALSEPDPDTPDIGIMIPTYGENEFQEYVTANGIEAATYRDDINDAISGESYDCNHHYRAHFIRNSALYTVEVYPADTWETGPENKEFPAPWNTLIEILDAYK